MRNDGNRNVMKQRDRGNGFGNTIIWKRRQVQVQVRRSEVQSGR